MAEDIRFRQYRKKGITEARLYEVGEELPSNVSISPEDKKNGSPKHGDMIARDTLNHNDQWLISEAYFNKNYEAVE